jgi:hypothetical protein
MWESRRHCEISKELWKEGKSCFWISPLSIAPSFPQLSFIVLSPFAAALVDNVSAMGGWPAAAPASVAAAPWPPPPVEGWSGASRFPRDLSSGRRNGFLACRPPIHTPPPCSAPAHIDFAALLGTIDFDAEPPNRSRSRARSPAGTPHPVPSGSASYGDSPPLRQPPVRTVHYARLDTPSPDIRWRPLSFGSSCAAASSPAGPGASRDSAPLDLSLAVNWPR